MKRKMMMRASDTVPIGPAKKLGTIVTRDLESGFGVFAERCSGCRESEDGVSAFVTLPGTLPVPNWSIKTSSLNGLSYLWVMGPGYLIRWCLGAETYVIIRQARTTQQSFVRHVIYAAKR